jgi:uncharacterized protein (DUF433 family)
MSEVHEFTAAEAAFVLGEPVRAVKKALDEGPVRARIVKKAGFAVRAIERADLLYLYAVRALRAELTPKARHAFYHALKGSALERVHEIKFGQLSVIIDDFRAEVDKRARKLSELAEKVEFRRDGEAVLKGTQIEVHRIAALLAGGMTPEQVREDYPSLSLEAIATAKTYADAHPKAGRPYPSGTVKRAIKGIGLEALDEVLGEEE